MTDVLKSSPVPRVTELFQTYTKHFGEGLVPTDGIQRTSVATFGLTAVEILNELIDPGVDMTLQELQVGLTQRFTELTGGTTSGSLAYYWEARQESVATTRGYVNITGTFAKGVASGASAEDTFSGYVPVGSVPQAPFRLRLTADSLYADAYTGDIKNSSFVRLVGIVIPGA